MSLVKFVEHQRAHAAQRSVEGHLTKQYTLCHETDARAIADARFEAYLITHYVAERNRHFLGHTFRQHAGGETARLQDDDFAAFAEQTMAEKHLRDLRGFAGAGRRLHDQPPLRPKAGDDGVFDFVDGQFAR